MVGKLKARFGSSPVWPALLSGLVAPGLGQLYNREFVKGGILLFASVGSFLWFSRTVTQALSLILPGTPDQWTLNQKVFRDAVTKVVGQNPDMFVTFEVLIVVVWVFGTVDAYLTARRRPAGNPGSRPLRPTTLSVRQARELDRRATADYGLPSLILMESAARTLAEIVQRSLISPIQMCNTAFICGTGNNGGDGFAAARHLLQRGTKCMIFLVGDAANMTPDAAINFRIIQKLGIPVFPFSEFAEKRREWDRRPVLLVDAMLGTGFKGPLKPAVLEAIRQIEDLKKNHTSSVRVLAVDVPTGLNADDGSVAEAAVPADITVTIACNKPGLQVPQARPYAGRVEVIDIGIPSELATKISQMTFHQGDPR